MVQLVKNLPTMWETWVQSLSWKDPLEKGKVGDENSMVCGVAKSRPRLSLFNRLMLHTGEGNGNPLQYSCLENPVDREAWWAAVYGVTQSRTRLK